MKKILLSLLFVPAVAFSQIAPIPSIKVCTDKESMFNTLIEFGEEPFMTMRSSTQSADGLVEEYPAVLFINAKTKTFTLVEQWNDNFFCVLALGNNIAPYINNQRTSFKE